MGRGQPIYVMPLQAQPYQGEVPDGFYPLPVKSLIYPFDLRIEQGLSDLGDYGVTADVMRLQDRVVQDMKLSDQLLCIKEAKPQARVCADACREW
jgi:hypothetical protein